MKTQPVTGRFGRDQDRSGHDDALGGCAGGSFRRLLALLVLAGMIAAFMLAVAASAQAHEPWVAKAWGRAAEGQLGDGTANGPETCVQYAEAPACSTTPVPVSGLSGVTAVAGGGSLEAQDFALALLETGKVMAWGSGDFRGSLGNGTKKSSDVPVEVTGLSEPAKAVAAGSEHALALLSDGKVMEWGKLATGGESDVPVEVVGFSEPVKAIAAGGEMNLAVLEGGTAMVWGHNAYGGLGDGQSTSPTPTTVCAPAPEPCPGSELTGVSAVSADNVHSLALLGNGSVMAWGANSEGELGDGSETASEVPLQVSGLEEVAAIAAGGHLANGGEPFNLALLESGAVVAWGSNENDQLGDGNHTGPESCGSFMLPCAKRPVPVCATGTRGECPSGPYLTDVTAIAARAGHSLALLGNRTVVAWGENKDGQLGDGNNTGPEPCLEQACSADPVAVSNLVDVKAIGAGSHFSLAFGPPPPLVTAIGPKEGPKAGHTTVTVAGADLEEATAVKFGTANATSFTVNSEGSITAVSPAGTGIVDVTVTTLAGTSPTSAADQFDYSRPVVKKVKPRKGPQAGGTKVTISGTNFTGATAVKFDTTEATSFEAKSETEIVAISPPHAKGRVDVTVTTPTGGTSLTSGKDGFKYQ